MLGTYRLNDQYVRCARPDGGIILYGILGDPMADPHYMSDTIVIKNHHLPSDSKVAIPYVVALRFTNSIPF